MGGEGQVSTSRFASHLASHHAGIKRRTPDAMNIQYLPSSRSRFALLHSIRDLVRGSRRHPVAYLPLLAVAGPVFVVGSWLTNKFLRPTTKLPAHGLVSSLLITINAAAIRAKYDQELAAEDDLDLNDSADLAPSMEATFANQQV
jgi:hypothetical protein